MKELSKTYLQYGVPSALADKYAAMKLSASQFRTTKIADLENFYKIDRAEIDLVKDCLTRSPIDEGVLANLLNRNAYLCCLCANINGQSGYVVHHIDEYSETQDNSYENLAVLCPNHHDMAHSKSTLTRRLSSNDLRDAKTRWEETVKKYRVDAAAGVASVDEIDYINIARVDELALQVLGQNVPPIRGDRGIIFEPRQDTESATPLINLVSENRVRMSYLASFRDILYHVKFVNLDDLLNAHSLRSPEIIGTFCYYVGGLYGKGIPWPFTKETPPGRLYLRRRQFRVFWPINPMYICSSTAFSRLTSRSIHIVYGRIRNVMKDTDDAGATLTVIEVRPYVVGWPKVTPDRTPLVRYLREAQGEVLDDEDDASGEL